MTFLLTLTLSSIKKDVSLNMKTTDLNRFTP